MGRWFKVGAAGIILYSLLCMALYRRDRARDAENLRSLVDSIQFYQSKIDFGNKQIANAHQMIAEADKAFAHQLLPGGKAQQAEMHSRVQSVVESVQADISEYTVQRDRQQAKLRIGPSAKGFTSRALIGGAICAAIYVAVVAWLLSRRKSPQSG